MPQPRMPRFIPTRVGNIWDAVMDIENQSVHPHTCGEHTGCLRLTPPRDGSSPHVWGTCFGHVDKIIGGRFIPTRVGNIVTASGVAWSITVHPHTCGEHGNREPGKDRRRGSSPHVWGTLHPPFGQQHGFRFIPTRVGNMNMPDSRSRYVSGSSPHVWGTCAGGGQLLAGPRFIPTRVGNIRPRPAGFPGTAVHPHTCGEHCLFAA